MASPVTARIIPDDVAAARKLGIRLWIMLRVA